MYNLFLILILHVIVSGGSVKADILVLAKVKEQTSKAEVTTLLMDGFDTAFKNSLGISTVIVNGKWSTTRIITFFKISFVYCFLVLLTSYVRESKRLGFWILYQ